MSEKFYKTLMNIRETYTLDGEQLNEEMSDEVATLLATLLELKKPNPSPYQNEEVVMVKDIQKLFADVQKHVLGVADGVPEE